MPGGGETSVAPVGVSAVGSGLEGSGLVGSGDASEGRPESDVAGGAEGLVAGGGASGGVGDTGASEDLSSGIATRAATAHDRPAPAAARSSRRRAAPRRTAS